MNLKKIIMSDQDFENSYMREQLADYEDIADLSEYKITEEDRRMYIYNHNDYNEHEQQNQALKAQQLSPSKDDNERSIQATVNLNSVNGNITDIEVDYYKELNAFENRYSNQVSDSHQESKILIESMCQNPQYRAYDNSLAHVQEFSSHIEKEYYKHVENSTKRYLPDVYTFDIGNTSLLSDNLNIKRILDELNNTQKEHGNREIYTSKGENVKRQLLKIIDFEQEVEDAHQFKNVNHKRDRNAGTNKPESNKVIHSNFQINIQLKKADDKSDEPERPEDLIREPELAVDEKTEPFVCDIEGYGNLVRDGKQKFKCPTNPDIYIESSERLEDSMQSPRKAQTYSSNIYIETCNNQNNEKSKSSLTSLEKSHNKNAFAQDLHWYSYPKTYFLRGKTAKNTSSYRERNKLPSKNELNPKRIFTKDCKRSKFSTKLNRPLYANRINLNKINQNHATTKKAIKSVKTEAKGKRQNPKKVDIMHFKKPTNNWMKFSNRLGYKGQRGKARRRVLQSFFILAYEPMKQSTQTTDYLRKQPASSGFKKTWYTTTANDNIEFEHETRDLFLAYEKKLSELKALNHCLNERILHYLQENQKLHNAITNDKFMQIYFEPMRDLDIESIQQNFVESNAAMKP